MPGLGCGLVLRPRFGATGLTPRPPDACGGGTVGRESSLAAGAGDVFRWALRRGLSFWLRRGIYKAVGWRRVVAMGGRFAKLNPGRQPRPTVA